MIWRVGADEYGRPLRLDLADASHLAIQGVTRSGKSVLVYGLLMAAAGSCDAVVAGGDPTGILFAPFRSAPRSEWRVSRLQDMQAYPCMLAALVDEMDTRIDALLSGFRDKLTSFDAMCPLILVVLEEYPGLIAALREDDAANARKPGERLVPKVERLLGRLVREGAKVGFRVVLMAQRLSTEVLSGDIRGNFATRISMRMDDPVSVRMLHPSASDNLVQANLSMRPGHGVFEQHGELVQFTGDYMDYRGYVRSVTACYGSER